MILGYILMIISGFIMIKDWYDLLFHKVIGDFKTYEDMEEFGIGKVWVMVIADILMCSTIAF